IEARIARRGWLLRDQCNLSWTAASPKVIRESEYQSQCTLLILRFEIVGNGRHEVRQGGCAAPHAWSGGHVELVVASPEQTSERLEIWRAGPRLVGRNRRLCSQGAACEVRLGQCGATPGIAKHHSGVHSNIIYIRVYQQVNLTAIGF